VNFHPLQWLDSHAQGFSQLSLEEKDAIMHFSLLWSLFEAQVLDTDAKVSKIQRKCEEWNSDGLLCLNDFKRYLDYFKDRYVENGELNHRFQNLRLSRSCSPQDVELVSNVLKGSANTIKDIVAVLLIIVFRFRNNFFHGVKWAYDFRGQKDNFSISNQLLAKAIEINSKPRTPTSSNS